MGSGASTGLNAAISKASAQEVKKVCSELDAGVHQKLAAALNTRTSEVAQHNTALNDKQPSAPGQSSPAWSIFGEKFTRHSGIAMLMEDLEEGVKMGALMMGGGNPAQIPEVKAEISDLLTKAMDTASGSTSGLVEALSNYDGPRGKVSFVEAFAAYLRSELGWDVTSENLAITNGSQGSFFYLFNLFCGAPSGHRGPKKRVLLPVCPEYLGYADVGLDDDLFISAQPKIEICEAERTFKYRLNLQAVQNILEKAGGSTGIGLMCVSRPTNPTGNVITDEELRELQNLAKEHNIPLVVDGAYGMPFPKILFAENVTMPHWSEDSGLIFCFSLSKLGFPGARTGVVVCPKVLAKAFVNLNGVLSLAPGSVGPLVSLPLLTDEGRMNRLCDEVIQPFYRQRAEMAKNTLLEALKDEPRVICHRPEGCIFLWLWCRDLPVDSQEMYRRLKGKGVLVIPGHFFFPGLPDADSWRHTTECLRISYAGISEDEQLIQGLHTIAAAVLTAYQEPVAAG